MSGPAGRCKVSETGSNTSTTTNEQALQPRFSWRDERLSHRKERAGTGPHPHRAFFQTLPVASIRTGRADVLFFDGSRKGLVVAAVYRQCHYSAS